MNRISSPAPTRPAAASAPFLLTALRRYLGDAHERQHAAKRGGDRTTFVPLEDTALEEQRSVPPEAARRRAEEARFDRRWAETLVEHALDRLAAEWSGQHGADHFARLLPFLTDEDTGAGEDARVTAHARHTAAAAELGLSLPAFKSALHRLRSRYRTLLREAVALTVVGPAAIEPELLYLCVALAARAVDPAG